MIAFGHLPDLEDPDDWHFGQIVGVGAGSASARYADSIDYRPFCAPVRDQPAQDCVGEAVCAAVDTQQRLSGHVQRYGSPMGAYTLGRSWGLAFETPIFDVGSQPRLVIKAAQKYGLVPLEEWDPGPDDFNTKVPFDVIHAGARAKIGSYANLDIGDDIVANLIQALSQGFVPIFAMLVDQAFVDWRSSDVYPGRLGKALGRHMMAIVGGEFSGLGALPHFLVRNSWGAGYGDGGYVRIAATHVAGYECTDRRAFTSIPAIEAA